MAYSGPKAEAALGGKQLQVNLSCTDSRVSSLVGRAAETDPFERLTAGSSLESYIPMR